MTSTIILYRIIALHFQPFLKIPKFSRSIGAAMVLLHFRMIRIGLFSTKRNKIWPARCAFNVRSILRVRSASSCRSSRTTKRESRSARPTLSKLVTSMSTKQVNYGPPSTKLGGSIESTSRNILKLCDEVNDYRLGLLDNPLLSVKVLWELGLCVAEGWSSERPSFRR